MRSTVLTKTLLDQARLLVAWAAALALLIGMYVALWPSIRDQPAMNAFLEQMPDAFRSLFAATGADMSTPVGYLKVELLSFMGPSRSSSTPSALAWPRSPGKRSATRSRRSSPNR
jgi:ABC-2 type transport system permease protein